MIAHVRLTGVVVCVFALSCLFFLPEPARSGADGDAQKAFQAGNFDNTVQILVEKLRKKIDHQDNINLLDQALAMGVKKHVTAAEDCETRSEWDCAYIEYVAAKKLGDAVGLLPPVKREFKKDGKKVKEDYTFGVPSFSDAIAKTRNNAILTHFEKGKEYQTAQKFKDAAIEFRLTRQYDPSYEDAATRYDECRKKATLRIAVVPFENISGKTLFGEVGQIVADQIISNALSYNPEFIEFITRDYLNQLLAEQGIQQSTIVDQSSATQLGKKAGVHAFVFGKVSSIIANYPGDEKKPGHQCIEVTNYDTKPATKRTLCATWNFFVRQGQVKVDASYQIVNVEKGNIMSAQTVSATSQDVARWCLFEGSKEAIPDEITSQITSQGEASISPAEVLVNGSMESLSKDLATALCTYFK